MINILFLTSNKFDKIYDLSKIISYFDKKQYCITYFNSKDIIDRLETLVLEFNYIVATDIVFTEFIQKSLIKKFHKNQKICVIRTLDSFDIFHRQMPREISDSSFMNNLYLITNNIFYDINKKINIYDKNLNPNNMYCLQKLLSINHLKNISILLHKNIKKNDKKEYIYEKYKLDNNKKIAAIFLTWPKNMSTFPTRLGYIEKYFINNINLIEKIKNIFYSNGYNLVFKAHPYYGIRYDPLTIKSKRLLSKKFQKISTIKINEMKPIIDKFTFIENNDIYMINNYIDIGLLLNCTTFGLHNYFYNIPLLYISDDNNYLSNSYKYLLKDKYNVKENDPSYEKYTTGYLKHMKI